MSTEKKEFNVGLANAEAQALLAQNGYNELEEKQKTPLIIRFLMQFKDILVIILLIAALISFIVDPHEWIESLIIVAVVILNAILGLVQESKAEKSLEALKKMSSPNSKVIRDGKQIVVPSRELVLGDAIVIEAGDFIPADAKLIESYSLKIDESALTGESVPVDKEVCEVADDAPIGDRVNMVFSSTFATYGRGIAIVTSTAMNTEIGKIATMLNSEEDKMTPLQHKLEQIGKVMGILSIAICAIVFILQLFTNDSPNRALESFKIAVSLAVAAIPEGLATVVTIILSIGVSKMARQNAIVKKLPAVETLGCTSIVCSDKTGTLTQNKMTVVEYYENKTHKMDDGNKSLLVSYSAICSDAKIEIVDGKENRIGDPTETALIEANNKVGLLDISNIERVFEIPFDSDRKLMTVVVKLDGKFISITKGAPDQIFKICNDETSAAVEENMRMAKNALRVLGVGIKEVQEGQYENLESDLNFIGLVGMIDPERKEVKEAVRIAKKAGVKTVMITGDHVVTAEAIARNLGIFGDGDIAITSEELNKLSDDELDEKLEHISVYARVAPSDKVRIVKAWQRKGKVVSMTGDGVNDSPALKAADIGCAMGITGTDVSKQAAAMILVDDNFSTIISAVAEGRNIYANIKKCVKYLLSSNIGEVFTIFTVSLIALISGNHIGTPLLATHLLWINLITDSLPSFALGLEESGSELMNEKPRAKDESFFAHGLGWAIGIEGIFIGTITVIAFFIGYNAKDLAHGQTMAFVTLSMLQLFHSFNMKSEDSVLNKNLFKNKWLIYSFILGIVLQMIVLYVPGINDVFKLYPLEWNYLLIALGLSFSIIVIIEVYKFIKKMLRKAK